MKLWTIQTQDVWATLTSKGVWRAREPFVPDGRLNAYRWLTRHMQIRLGQPMLADQMPVWVWHQWDGVRRLMPDLRSSGHLATSTSGVRIELELALDRVLLSDYHLWHHVLNYWYLAASVGDQRSSSLADGVVWLEDGIAQTRATLPRRPLKKVVSEGTSQTMASPQSVTAFLNLSRFL
jgi:hypothetical protein